MKRYLITFFSSVLMIFLITGCSEKNEISTDEDVAAIKKLVEEWTASMNAGDADRIAAFYTEDGIEMPPGRSRVGKEAIQARFHSVFERLSGEVITSVDEIIVVDGWAFMRGSVSITWTPVDGGDTFQESSKGLRVLQRQPDGSWKMARNMWNKNVSQSEMQ